MTDASYLAIDWGTTNRRTYLIDAAGRIIDRHHDARGVTAIAPGAFDGELADLRRRFGDRPAIAAGMIGSTRGWQEVPYVPAPAAAADLAAGLVRVPHADLLIVPGVALDEPTRADVMRGEEVQALGACLALLAPPDALFCQPGTHSKWIEMRGGRIARFVTAMPGELFGLLRDRSILAEWLRGPVSDGAAFRDGVGAAAAGDDLLSLLFGVRAAVLRGRLSPDDAAARASGLLIGADVAARQVAGRTIHLLADAALGPLYAAAIAACGGTAELVDAELAFQAGIHAIWTQRHA